MYVYYTAAMAYTQSSTTDWRFLYKFKIFVHSNESVLATGDYGDCVSQRHCISTEPLSLNVDKKWQSDDLFYIIMNEIRPGVDQF